MPEPLAVNPDPWTEHAACRGDWDDFDNDTGKTGGGRTQHLRKREALARCYECPVIRECAALAVRTRADGGVWGGVNIPWNKNRNAERENIYRRLSRATGEPYVPPPAQSNLGSGRRPTMRLHGTDGGYYRHRADGTPVCDDCRHAHAAANAQRAQRRQEVA